MDRITYKDALRAKGVKPIPPAIMLRSSLRVRGAETIDATEALMKEYPR